MSDEDMRGSQNEDEPPPETQPRSSSLFLTFWRRDKPENAFAATDRYQGSDEDGSGDDMISNNYEDNNKSKNGEEKKAELSFLGLLAVCYFLVCGGAYGTEDLASSIPPLFAWLGMLVIPWFWSLPIALIVAELGSTLPSAEGFLGWIRTAWGSGPAFIDGWIMIMTIIIDQSSYPVIFIAYVESIEELEPIEEFMICVGYIIFAMCLNLLGVSSVGNASMILTCITLVPFAIYFFAGFFSDNFDPSVLLETEMPEGKDPDVALYLSVLVWATCAYEYSGFLAGDVANPRKVFPVAMFTVVTMMILTYLLPLLTTISTAKDLANVTDGSYPDLATDLGLGKWLAYMIIGGGLASTMGTYITYLHTSATAVRGLAAQGMAPAIFNAFPKLKVPVVGIIFFSCTTVILVNFEFGVLIQIESFLYCVHAILLVSCLLRLRIKLPDLERPYRLPFGWVGAVLIPIAPACVGLAQIASIFYDTWVYGVLSLVLLAGGVCVYLALSWYNKRYNQPVYLGGTAKDAEPIEGFSSYSAKSRP